MEEKKEWWAFFPLMGFVIKDEKDDLEKPIFGDFSIISTEQIKDVVSRLELNERGKPGHDHEGQVLALIDFKGARQENYKSYLAIKRVGSFSPDERSSKLLLDMETRAKEVSALLTLVFLYDNKHGRTCGLVEQLHRNHKKRVLMQLDTGNFSYQMGGHTGGMLLSPERYIKLKREELNEYIYQNKFINLTNTLLRKSKGSKSIRNSIIQSALRLSDSIHAIDISSRVLGVITAIEILISELGDSFDTIKRRLRVLIGVNQFDKYSANEVFMTRHRYVHKGKQIEDWEISLKAIALGLLCLFHFAEASYGFRNRMEFIHYLDFVNKAQMLESSWGSEEKKAFNTLLHHSNDYHSFGFI